MTNPKTKLIINLFIISTVLLIVNLLVDKFTTPSESEKISSEISRAKIENVFYSVLDDYGINAFWITTKKNKSSLEDSIQNVFEVKIPTDVPIPMIIKDIKKVIVNDITAFVCNEKKIFGLTEIKIYTNEILKLHAVFMPDESLNRDKNKIAFIISDAFKLGASDYQKFLASHYPLSAMVVPNAENRIKADTLKNYYKEYCVILDDDNDEKQFRLETGHQPELLKRSVSSILSQFNKAKLITVDNESKLYNSAIYNFVEKQFQIGNRELLSTKKLIDLRNDQESELISRFLFFSSDTSGTREKIILTGFENFIKLEPEVNKFRKKGGKIIAVPRM